MVARRRGSVDDATDKIGRAGKSEVAHQVRNEALILVVALVGQGEHGGDDNCSPESLLPSGTLGRCRERGYKARRCKTEGALDTCEEGEYASVI